MCILVLLMSEKVQPATDSQVPSYGAFSGPPPPVSNYAYDQFPQGPEVGQWVGQAQVPEQFVPGGSDPSKWTSQGPVGTQAVGAAMVMPSGSGPGGEPSAALPIEHMDVIPGYDTAIRGELLYFSFF